MGYVDLHCHLLPNLDDGSPSMAASLELARDAVADGVSHALVTPHHLNRRYVNHKETVMQSTSDFQAALNEAGIDLTVFPGQEVHLSNKILAALDQDDILFADEGGRYMLLELPSNEVPHYTKSMIYQLQSRGITPVIVHPERNNELVAHPERLADLLELGCLSQITASSYLGTFGKDVERAARLMVNAGQGTVMASDAHVMEKRDYELGAAMRRLAKDFGRKVAGDYQQNAKDILNGDPVRMTWEPIKQKKRFWLF